MRSERQGTLRVLVAFIRQANSPGTPEQSLPLRFAAWGAVLISLTACLFESELSVLFVIVAACGVTLGMAYSYIARTHSSGWLKLLLALGALAAFVYFFHTISNEQGIVTIGSVEAPLAVLFTLMQVLHSFDVRARRDLMFSLAGSATLMAVAAAQATNLTFGVFVISWAFICGYGLVSTWASMSGARLRMLGLPMALWVAAASILAGVIALALLPPPQANHTLAFPRTLARDLHLPVPGAISSGGRQGNLPAQPGSPAGRLGVGGYLGFSGPLNLAVRGQLSNEVIMRVRASVPGYWLGETFDHWNGVSWTNDTSHVSRIGGGPDFVIPGAPTQRSSVNLPTAAPAGTLQQSSAESISLPHPASFSTGSFGSGSVGTSGSADIQTFYVQKAIPSLIFGVARRMQVWFAGNSLYLGPGRSIRTGYAMGPGTIYTVMSSPDRAMPQAMKAASRLAAGQTAYPAGSKVTIDVNGTTETVMGTVGLTGTELAQYTQLPGPSKRYAALNKLAHSIVRGSTSVYGEVQALEGWMGRHLKYSTNIPPLPPRTDAVNEFIFHTKTGYCEQISSSLAVMLRLLGVPAREAVGYVPGPYNPITDLYDVQAKDAHAWVQAWFPGLGWQSFDPTAHVPLANPSPGSVLIDAAGKYLGRVGTQIAGVIEKPFVWPPLLLLVSLAGTFVYLKRRPNGVAERALRRLERKGSRIGIERMQNETLREYAGRLSLNTSPDDLIRFCQLLEAGEYGSTALSALELNELEGLSKRLVRKLARK
ncbi:MAG: transglutaminase family protein [Acidimicrobiales bacterium]